MAIAHSKITAQGQISVPAEVRRRLGVGPGAILEWELEGGEIVIRRGGRYASAEIHAEVFGSAPVRRRSEEELKEGVREYVRRRYARG